MNTQRAAQPDGQSPVALQVNGVDWWFSVAAVTRVERDVFVQVALDGPESCMATFHVRDRVVFGITARDILTAACEWLARRGAATHAFIDLAEASAVWQPAAVA